MKTSPLEKIGTRIFRSLGETSSSIGDDTHILTPEERQALRLTERRTITLAATAGALSALAAGIAAIIAENLYQSGPPETHQSTQYWLLFGGITGIAAIIEIVYLYYITLRAVHKIAGICDLKLDHQSHHSPSIATDLIRAAMELPSPQDGDPHIDPYRGYPKWRLIIVGIIYKTKVMASNAIFKIVVRKIFLRGAARAWLEFLAIPVTAFWNGIVTYWILREARIRALGPSAITQSLPNLLTDSATHQPAQRAIGCCIHASHDLHPNLAHMLRITRELTNTIITDAPENLQKFHQSLTPLNPTQQQTVLHILTLATIIDGRVARNESQLLKNTAQHINSPPLDPKPILNTFLKSNEPIIFERLTQLSYP